MKEHVTYRRLLQAAAELKEWRSPAEIARHLTVEAFSASDQKITNWKSRGLSKEAILKASKIIGCRPLWLLHGTGMMVDIGAKNDDRAIDDIARTLAGLDEYEKGKVVGMFEDWVTQISGYRGNAPQKRAANR